VADSRLTWSVKTVADLPTDRAVPLGCAYWPVVTADGKAVICSGFGVLPPGTPAECSGIAPRNDVGLLEYSTATGKLVRTLYSYTNCTTSGVLPLWASSASGKVMGYLQPGKEPYPCYSASSATAHSPGCRPCRRIRCSRKSSRGNSDGKQLSRASRLLIDVT
jgi:hypothetical protein